MKKVFILLFVSLIFSCSANYNSNSSFSEQSSSSISSSAELEKELLIEFDNNKSAIDLSENQDESQKVKNLFGDYLLSMKCSKVYEDLGYIKLGSGSSSGKWELDFNYPLIKIDFELKNYTKAYQNTIQNDKPVFLVNNNNLELDFNQESDVFKLYSFAFTKEEKQVVLESKPFDSESKGRTLIKSMKLFFK